MFNPPMQCWTQSHYFVCNGPHLLEEGILPQFQPPVLNIFLSYFLFFKGSIYIWDILQNEPKLPRWSMDLEDRQPPPTAISWMENDKSKLFI